MDMSSLNAFSVAKDPSYYAECFRMYDRYTSRYEKFSDWAETVFRGNVVEKLPFEEGQKELKILGVGSGSGELDCKLISQILKKFPSISSTVIEPNREHITHFKNLVENQGFLNLSWDWRQQTWEQFYDEWKVVSEGSQMKFHFISAIHTLYYIADIESAILNMIKSLQDGGILMIILISEHNSLCQQWKRFPMLAVNTAHRVTAGDVRRVLKKHQVKFEAVTQKSNIDIACCYEDGNQDGVILLDFLSHVKLREFAPQSFVDELLSHMRECAIQDGDRTLYNDD